MSAPKMNPRRRPCINTSTSSISSSSSSSSSPSYHKLHLKKGATFHSPSTPPPEDQPRLNLPTLLRRSPTSPRSLGHAIAEGEKRMAAVIGSLERGLSGLSGLSGTGSDSESKPARLDEDFPVPRGILDANIPTDRDGPRPDRIKKEPRSPRINHRHTSDSGIGTSISSRASAQEDIFRLLPGPKDSLQLNKPQISNSSSTKSAKPTPSLSAFSFKKIKHHILGPLFRNEALTRFRPLLKGIPSLVVRDEIRCLRDLEKHIQFRSPIYAPSIASYVHFCEVAIQCIHSTVPHLPPRDLVRANDRPYTNGYFLDLVHQIRQYAASVNAARREGQADHSFDKITLEGGISENGRPAELVRTTADGQKVSLKNNLPYEEMAPGEIARSKRKLEDEAPVLSMARRKKGEPPMDIKRPCPHPSCSAIGPFKRLCDYNKHMKTHTRPFKCYVESCKYHTYGWPTEKECQRHVNDKHSANPEYYHCRVPNCSYKSKRDSNCKQHMEKAHNIPYVRTKGNGKRASDSNSSTFSFGSRATQTPQPQMLQSHSPNPTQLPSPRMSPNEQPLDVNGTSAYQQTFASPYQQTLGMNSSAYQQHGFSTNMAFPHALPMDSEWVSSLGDAPGPSESNVYGNNMTTDHDMDNFMASLQASDPNELSIMQPLSSNVTSNQTHFSPTPPIEDYSGLFPNSATSSNWQDFHFEQPNMNAQLLTPQELSPAFDPSYLGEPSTFSPTGRGNVMLCPPMWPEAMNSNAADPPLYNDNHMDMTTSTALDSANAVYNDIISTGSLFPSLPGSPPSTGSGQSSPNLLDIPMDDGGYPSMDLENFL